MNTAPIPISRAVNERSVSTLDLSLWTPEIQSGAGRLGVCGCMTLSANESECVCGAYLPIGRKEKSIIPLLRFLLEGGIRITLTPRRAERRVYRGVAAPLSLPSDSRSAPVGLEDKRTKCVNPMGMMPSCVWVYIIDG